MNTRYIEDCVTEDLSEKMVFIGGPRQVGKTTCALSMLPGNQDETSPAYLNWDLLEDRERIMAAQLPPNEKLVILDEIHKYVNWRNLVKGLYDKNKSSVSFLVTGSARLDYFRERTDIPRFYQVHLGEKSFGNADSATLVLPFSRFCQELRLP